MLTKDHVELFSEQIFLENLRRLVESPMGVLFDGTKLVQHSWKPTRMTCHVSFGSRYQRDDIGTHIFEHIDQMMRQKILP